jgi:hypothetical protein
VLEAAAAASNPNLKDMQAQVLGAINGLKEGGALGDELRLRLNMATGQLQAAARDAVQVARFEQVRGRTRRQRHGEHSVLVVCSSRMMAAPQESWQPTATGMHHATEIILA